MQKIDKLDWVEHLIGWKMAPILMWTTFQDPEQWALPKEGMVYPIGGMKYAYLDETSDGRLRGKNLYRTPSDEDLDGI